MENAAAPTRRPQKPRERNSILKKYYGIKDTTAAPIQTQDNSRPFDLDGNTFNSSKYFASLLKEKPLHGLVEKDNQLVGEIREIDGDMKTLVYENYSKFISATDTIRKMKLNVESMESEMSRLNDNISEISKQSRIINQELGPNRQKIQQLSNVHNSLKRLQFIFELPNRLQHCLNKQKYGQAVKYYSKASRLLNHYKHMAAFKGIERDCHHIMEKVKAEIWAGMTDPNVTLQKIADETKLLVLLDEDARKLWKQYIKTQMDMLHKKQSELGQPSSITELVSIYITPLEDIVHHFEGLFLANASENSIDSHTISIASLNDKEKQEARTDLLAAINPLLDKFFDLASEFIELPLNISLETPLKQADHLTELKSALTNSTHSLTSVAKIDERTISLTASWENDLINGLLDSAIGGLKDLIHRFSLSLLKQADSTDINKDEISVFIQDTQAWLINHLVQRCLLPLKGCLDITNADTLSRIQVGIKQVWQKLAVKIENVYKAPEVDRVSLQILMLVASRLCYDLADTGIFKLYSTFSSEFYKAKSERRNYHSPDLDLNIEPRIIPDMNDIIELYLNKGQTLLNQQMMQEGYRLSTKIQEAYLLKTPSTTPVHQVSEIWFLVYNRLKYTEKLVEAVYPQHQTASRTSFDNNSESEYDYGAGSYSSRHVLPSTHSLATVSSISETPTTSKFGGNDMTLNMMNNIDKLFAERVDIYRKTEPTPIGVCIGLILIILKTFLEVSREIQMDSINYQQIQADVEYVKRIIWPYAGDEKWATTMLQEVLSSVYSRCASPKTISQDELALILSPQ